MCPGQCPLGRGEGVKAQAQAAAGASLGAKEAPELR